MKLKEYEEQIIFNIFHQDKYADKSKCRHNPKVPDIPMQRYNARFTKRNSIIQRYKIFITFHIFFDCFFQCLNDDFKKQALNTFNCSPPYITDDKNHWCTSVKNLSSKQNERLYE